MCFIVFVKKKKLMKIFLGLFLTLGACDVKKAEDNTNILTVGVCADYPPFEYYLDGEIVGFDIDLIKEIAHRLGKDIQIKDMSFSSLLGNLQTGRIDMAISAITPTDERRERVDFSEMYYVSKVALIVPKDSAISSLDDLKGKHLGAQTGSTYESIARTSLESTAIHSYEKIPDMLQDMKAGRVDALFLGNNEAGAITKTHSDIKLISIKDKNNPMAIALPKNSELNKQINTILIALKEEGFLSKLTAKWLNQSIADIKG